MGLAGHLAAPSALATPMRALLRLAQDDPHAATVALAPVLDESAPVGWRSWLVEAFLLEAIARDALGDPAAAGRALEQAFDLAGSPASCPSRRAPSRPTCATCTPSSASTAGPRRSSPPAPWACSHPPHAHAESVAAAAKQTSQPPAGSVG